MGQYLIPNCCIALLYKLYCSDADQASTAETGVVKLCSLQTFPHLQNATDCCSNLSTDIRKLCSDFDAALKEMLHASEAHNDLAASMICDDNCKGRKEKCLSKQLRLP